MNESISCIPNSNGSSLLRRTAECASSVEQERAGSGTTPACCARHASKIRILLCAVRCVPASWTRSITRTYCSATFVGGTGTFQCKPNSRITFPPSHTFCKLHFISFIFFYRNACEKEREHQTYNMTEPSLPGHSLTFLCTPLHPTDGYTWSVSVRTQAKQKSTPERTTLVLTAGLLLQSRPRTWM